VLKELKVTHRSDLLEQEDQWELKVDRDQHQRVTKVVVELKVPKVDKEDLQLVHKDL
jgi:HSP20 family molecular chaperone IbpA